MTRSEVITSIYALFNAPHNADINLVGLNKVLDDLVSAEREACAKIFDDAKGTGRIASCREAAIAIRARGNP
jgi:hypothetical protein